MPYFLAINAISLKFVRRTESVQQRNHWVGHKNGQKTPFLWPTDDSFVALTQCDELVLKKGQKLPKKETWSKLKITVPRKFDWGTLALLSRNTQILGDSMSTVWEKGHRQKKHFLWWNMKDFLVLRWFLPFLHIKKYCFGANLRKIKKYREFVL